MFTIPPKNIVEIHSETNLQGPVVVDLHNMSITIPVTRDPDWYSDAILIATDSKLIKGLSLGYDFGKYSKPIYGLMQWLQIPSKVGNLRIVNAPNNIYRTDISISIIDPVDFYWFDTQADAILGWYARIGKTEATTRLTIADDLDLVFSEDYMLGWILNRPVKHVLNRWDSDWKTIPNVDAHKRALKQYFELIQVETLDRLEAQDPETYNVLFQMATKLKTLENKSQFDLALEEFVLSYLTMFYTE